MTDLVEWFGDQLNPFAGIMENLGYIILAVLLCVFGVVLFLKVPHPYLRYVLGFGLFGAGALMILFVTGDFGGI